MPRKKDNPTKPLGAMFSDRVLVKRRGKDFIIEKMNPRRRKKSSPAQKNGQQIFKGAVAYAKGVIKDPKKKAAYEKNLKGHRNAFQAALADVMKKNLRR
jgi:hypothetical protein